MPNTLKTIPKNRLPTVPADKMDEFLSELKSFKLRRVGSGNGSSQNTSNTSSGFERSQSSSQGSSFLEDRSIIGYKRKRFDSGMEAQSGLGESVYHQFPTRLHCCIVTSLKRRFMVASQTSTSSAASTSSTRLSFPRRHPATLHHPRRSTMLAMPPEVDGTTPSLCSDNDNEAEDRGPSTPPLLPSRSGVGRITDRFMNRQTAYAPASEAVPVEPREQILERDIHNLASQPMKQQQLIPPAAQLPTGARSLSSTSTRLEHGHQLTRAADIADDPFSRRPPSSPMLPETPRRPRPPGRVRSGSKPVKRPPIRNRSPSPSDDDDPLTLSFAPPDESTPALVPVGKRPLAQGQASRKQRRVTLDEEIRMVDPSYSEEERAMGKAEVQTRESSYSDEERVVSKGETRKRRSSYSDEERVVSKGETRRRQSSYSDEERASHELENGVLVGVGRRSKRLGFLAHGGAGGEPVMMGVGYVEGAVVDDEEVGGQRTKEAGVGKGKRKTRSTAGGKRKPKR